MSIFLNENSKVIVQGMTGGEGMKHTARMLASGTKIVGGVNARKAGTYAQFTLSDGSDVKQPVFGTVAEAIAETGADTSVHLRTAGRSPRTRYIEAIDAAIGLCHRHHRRRVPVHDSANFWAYAQGNSSTRIIGPELPRSDQPRQVQRRHHPGQHRSSWADRPGLQVRHSDLPDDVRASAIIGFSTAVGIGGDPIIGTTHIDLPARVRGRSRHEGHSHDR